MSAEQRVAHVHLEREESYHFTASFPDLPEAPPLALDEAPPLGEGAGPNPAALLAAALGTCLASSLTFCLTRARIEPSGVTADVAAHITRNERGRFRITGVDVDLSFSVAEQDAGKVDRCQGLFEDFCIVTESVRHGIPVNVRVKAGTGSDPIHDPALTPSASGAQTA